MAEEICIGTIGISMSTWVSALCVLACYPLKKWISTKMFSKILVIIKYVLYKLYFIGLFHVSEYVDLYMIF